MLKEITYMLLLLFNASRTLSYRSDLGVLASCWHGGGEVTKQESQGARKKEQTQINTIWFQNPIWQSGYYNLEIINPLGQANNVVFWPPISLWCVGAFHCHILYKQLTFDTSVTPKKKKKKNFAQKHTLCLCFHEWPSVHYSWKLVNCLLTSPSCSSSQLSLI